MKRILSIFSIYCLLLGAGGSFISAKALAVDVINPSCPTPTQITNGATVPAICTQTDGTTGNTLFGSDGIITIITEILSGIAGFIAILMTVIAGIRMMTAGGDANTLAEARASLFHALFSLVLIVLALTLIRFVLGKIT
jgi:hypothetical protein